MKITKARLKKLIVEEITRAELTSVYEEELTAGGMAKKSTDLDYARSTPRAQIGEQEATKLLKHLEDMGYVASRGAVTQLIEFLQTLEQNEDIRHGGWN